VFVPDVLVQETRVRAMIENAQERMIDFFIL